MYELFLFLVLILLTFAGLVRAWQVKQNKAPAPTEFVLGNIWVVAACILAITLLIQAFSAPGNTLGVVLSLFWAGLLLLTVIGVLLKKLFGWHLVFVCLGVNIMNVLGILNQSPLLIKSWLNLFSAMVISALWAFYFYRRKFMFTSGGIKKQPEVNADKSGEM